MFILQDHVIFPFTLEESLSELNECFRQTKRIRWNFSPLIAAIQVDHLAILEQFMKDSGMEIEDERSEIFFDCLRLTKEKASALEYV